MGQGGCLTLAPSARISRPLALGAAAALIATAALGLWLRGTIGAPKFVVVTSAPAPSTSLTAPGPAAHAKRRLVVPAGGDLQAALNAAMPGDVVELTAGATFVGNFELPLKPGAEWITVRSSAHERLPSPGSRVSPDRDAVFMAKIVSPNSHPAIRTAEQAHHYRFIGIEVTTTSDAAFSLIYLEAPNQITVGQAPTDIIIDRCYIHGTSTGDIRRGIALNGARITVSGSYVSDFHERTADSQAIMGWNGPGPFTIVNNYLEAAGENVMFGGADPDISGLVPSDIEIEGNLFSKPLAWKVDEPNYAGIHWMVKNLFELKNARRVLVNGNIFEHNWADAQTGVAVLFTVRNQDGGAPWSVVEDVTFTNNIVRHTANGIHLLGRDDNYPSEQTKRILIKNNMFYDVTTERWGAGGGGGRLFQVINGTADVVIDHNTAIHGNHIVLAEGAPNTGFVFRNNIVVHNDYGVFGTGVGSGLPALAAYFPGAMFTHNVLILRITDDVKLFAAVYPPDNFFALTAAAVGFVDLSSGNYALSKSSPYLRAGTDGKDIGVDFDALMRQVTQ